jgi:hypothetical protein
VARLHNRRLQWCLAARMVRYSRDSLETL